MNRVTDSKVNQGKEVFWYFLIKSTEKERTKEENVRERWEVRARNPGSFLRQDDGNNGNNGNTGFLYFILRSCTATENGTQE